MKFPSVHYLFTQAKNTLVRFYMPLLFAMLGTIFSLLQVNEHHEDYNRVLYTCAISISLSLGCALFVERSGRPKLHWLAALFCLVFAFVYWQWLAPTVPFQDFRLTLTFIVLMVVMHLFVAVAPYIGRNEPAGFWRYNESLFVRMIISGVFSAAIFIGVALALAACEKLFGMHIRDTYFARLWIITVGIFNTWFFLSGIPTGFDEINTEAPFPKPLKIFTQYILIPLVVLYMAILYAYGIKILVRWDLPHGWVSTLILCYSVIGILAILLVTPSAIILMRPGCVFSPASSLLPPCPLLYSYTQLY